MSYSFVARGKTKEETMVNLKSELDKVVELQPVHAADRDQAYAAADAFVALLPDNADGKDFTVSMSGSVTWTGEPGSHTILGASVNVSAYLWDAK